MVKVIVSYLNKFVIKFHKKKIHNIFIIFVMSIIFLEISIDISVNESYRYLYGYWYFHPCSNQRRIYLRSHYLSQHLRTWCTKLECDDSKILSDVSMFHEREKSIALFFPWLWTIVKVYKLHIFFPFTRIFPIWFLLVSF